ncbi:MAG: DsrE family protein [Thiohalocapsa sp.]|jgi:intracellular sulfur oxidation DsrE/DsrF family protein
MFWCSFERFPARSLTYWLLVAGALAASGASADEVAASTDLPEIDEVQRLVDAGSPPAGVMFNVLEYDEGALEWAAPRIERYVQILRGTYPGLDVAVISHGDEIMALQTSETHLYRGVHDRLERLTGEQGLVVHVCGAYARANGVDASEFADFVDVVPLATTQIEDYRAFGYVTISLEAPR